MPPFTSKQDVNTPLDLNFTYAQTLNLTTTSWKLITPRLLTPHPHGSLHQLAKANLPFREFPSNPCRASAKTLIPFPALNVRHNELNQPQSSQENIDRRLFFLLVHIIIGIWK